MTPDERAELAQKFLEHGHAYPLPVDCMNLARALLDVGDAREAAERERDGWRETAANFHRGMAYYRDTLDSLAHLFGEAAYIADDGSRSDEPLRAKFTELGKQLAARIAEIERERDEATARLRKHCLDESCCDGSDVMPDLIAERDTARARVADLEGRVATLAEALLEITDDAGPSAERTIARAALTQVGLSPTAAGVEP
mgnify:CR=1 FL=1